MSQLVFEQVEKVNLKIPQKLLNLAEEYVLNYGYTNIQELIRESLRDKIFEEKKEREEYEEDFLKDMKEIQESSSYLKEKESMDALVKLGEEAFKYKNMKDKNAKRKN